jgi:hypothetical protein
MQHRTSKGPGPANHTLTKHLVGFHPPVSDLRAGLLSHLPRSAVVAVGAVGAVGAAGVAVFDLLKSSVILRGK